MQFIINSLLCIILLANGFLHKLPFNIPTSGLESSSIQKGLIKIDIHKPIHYTEQTPLKKITGFYGLIGPDIKMSSIKTLYDLFIGDGMIQGIFFDNGTITFVKHFVRTNKLLYESNHGLFSKNIRMLPLYMMAYKMGIVPNIMGLSNTAFLKINQNIYTVFERDYPYKINIDIENKMVNTDGKIDIKGVNTFSGHSKYMKDTIHSIDYNIFLKSVEYFQLDRLFRKKHNVLIKTKYIPLIHDFYLSTTTTSQKQNIILVDSPLEFDILRTFPVVFNKHNPTYIHVYNTENSTITYKCSHAFYLFHYADVKKYNNTIEIYASLYDDIDFMSLHIEGKYRKIMINEQTGNVEIYKNAELENMNVDFPKKWGDFVILRYIENNAIAGFIICKGLEIIKRIRLPNNRHFCGEPEIIDIDGSPFLIGFSYDNNTMGYFSSININEKYEYEYFEIPLYTNVTIG